MLLLCPSGHGLPHNRLLRHHLHDFSWCRGPRVLCRRDRRPSRLDNTYNQAIVLGDVRDVHQPNYSLFATQSHNVYPDPLP